MMLRVKYQYQAQGACVHQQGAQDHQQGAQNCQLGAQAKITVLPPPNLYFNHWILLLLLFLFWLLWNRQVLKNSPDFTLYSTMNSHCLCKSLLSSDRFMSTRTIYCTNAPQCKG